MRLLIVNKHPTIPQTLFVFWNFQNFEDVQNSPIFQLWLRVTLLCLSLVLFYFFHSSSRNNVGEWHTWYKFNDISVEKFEMTDENLETECFGGEYKVPQTDSSNWFSSLMKLHLLCSCQGKQSLPSGFLLRVISEKVTQVASLAL